MPLLISDDELERAGLTESEARIELASRLFAVGKLSLWPAAQMAGMRRIEFEAELWRRNIPVYRPTLQDLYDDLAALEHLRR